LAQTRGEPDLTPFTAAQQSSMRAACRVAGLSGPASLYECLRSQVAALQRSPGEPDLTPFTAAQQSSMRAACRVAGLSGPASLYECLREKIAVSGSAPSEPTPITLGARSDTAGQSQGGRSSSGAIESQDSQRAHSGILLPADSAQLIPPAQAPTKSSPSPYSAGAPNAAKSLPAINSPPVQSPSRVADPITTPIRQSDGTNYSTAILVSIFLIFGILRVARIVRP
jgi:hypothetical protein